MRLVLSVNGVQLRVLDDVSRIQELRLDVVVPAGEPFGSAAGVRGPNDVAALEAGPAPVRTFGFHGEVTIPDDAALCVGGKCSERGARGFYYPALGEDRCGICEGR